MLRLYLSLLKKFQSGAKAYLLFNQIKSNQIKSNLITLPTEPSAAWDIGVPHMRRINRKINRKKLKYIIRTNQELLVLLSGSFTFISNIE